MAFKMKGNPLKMGTMATKSTMKMAKESAMKKYVSDAQRKAVHASKAESGMKMKKESPAKMGHSPKKMKKSAMKLDDAAKEKALNNAMPSGEVISISKESMAGAKKYGLMNEGGSFNMQKAENQLKRLQNMTSQTDSNRTKQAEIRKLMKAFS